MPKKSKKPISKKESENLYGEERYEVRLSGSGGQGLITAGVILAEAVAVGDGRNSAHTQSYGPEARGGRTRSDVVISDGEIYYPEATEVDLLLALTQEAADSYIPLLKEDGILIIDEDVFERKPYRSHIAVPFTRITREKLGSSIATNVVSLAFIAQYTGIVSKESLEKSVYGHFPELFAQKNKKALELGYNLGRKASVSREEECIGEALETEIDRT